jgi:hypothetical protein
MRVVCANPSSYVEDYFYYVLSLIETIVDPHTIVLFEPYDIDHSNKLRVGINYEHTLVRMGGRTSGDAKVGIVPVDGSPNETYLTRLVNAAQLSLCDVVIDYSIPNIHNVSTSNRFPDITKKHVYIAPCLYPIVWNQTGRTNNVLTTFIDIHQPRRKELLEKSNGLCRNVSDCFDSQSLCELYQKTKILINIHQTDHHHTFEELRVLPALRNGVIVISEDSPCKELVPYHACVLWTPYESILDTAMQVLSDYDTVWNRIFSEDNKQIIESLHDRNIASLRDHTRNNVH